MVKMDDPRYVPPGQGEQVFQQNRGRRTVSPKQYERLKRERELRAMREDVGRAAP